MAASLFPKNKLVVIFFQNNIPITECNFSFPLDTHVYAGLITNQAITTIQYIYKPKDYALIGKLTTQEYAAVLDCLKNSPNIKNKYRKLL